jgi:hypothetical protein
MRRQEEPSMSNEKESRGSGSTNERRSGSGTQVTQSRQPISHEKERSRSGEEDFLSQQSDADTEGASRQTSTAQDELGQE